MIKRTLRRIKMRAKLPTGDRIVIRNCIECNTPIWLWNDALELSINCKFDLRCSYCKQAQRAENAAIFGKS